MLLAWHCMKLQYTLCTLSSYQTKSCGLLPCMFTHGHGMQIYLHSAKTITVLKNATFQLS